MRKWILGLIIFAFTNVVAQSRKDIKNDAVEARDTKGEIFIEMNDGKILNFNELTIKHPPLSYEYLEGDGNKLDIEADSIKAFQTDKFYALRIFRTAKGLVGKLPYTELFAQRLRNGKIELFMIAEMKRDTYGPSGSSSSSGFAWSYYIRKGINTNVIPLTKGSLKVLIQDNKSLLDEYDDLFKKGNLYKSATTIIDEYN